MIWIGLVDDNNILLIVHAARRGRRLIYVYVVCTWLSLEYTGKLAASTTAEWFRVLLPTTTIIILLLAY